METLVAITAFVVTNWDSIIIVAASVLALVAVIAKRTSNTVDDEIVEAAKEVLDVARKVPVKTKPTTPPSATLGKVVDVLDEVGDLVKAVRK